ncbi:phosphohydrolase [Anoxybacterium hadale]|uniref:Phosphohydrolase n=2 Tax=Anoxybacterium hadale TaxID=3408580 RepID=A0ACD1AH08_9FIRM|nr:phosphohydrolase [Clostridiales bacterium]
MKDFTQHGRTDCLLHSISVSYYSLAAAGWLPFIWDKKSLVKGALLHDFFLYDWHTKDRSHRFHGFTHPSAALTNAQKEWRLNEKEADIIRTHMFPLIPAVPQYREGLLVCLVDKFCSAVEILRLRPNIQVKAIYLYTIDKQS